MKSSFRSLSWTSSLWLVSRVVLQSNSIGKVFFWRAATETIQVAMQKRHSTAGLWFLYAFGPFVLVAPNFPCIRFYSRASYSDAFDPHQGCQQICFIPRSLNPNKISKRFSTAMNQQQKWLGSTMPVDLESLLDLCRVFVLQAVDEDQQAVAIKVFNKSQASQVRSEGIRSFLPNPKMMGF